MSDMADCALKRPSCEILENSTDLPERKKICIDTELPKDESEVANKCLTPVQAENSESIIRTTEMDVGITEYISDYPGFSSVMKERYSDFLVNEIDLQSNVVRLTSMEKPTDPTDNIQLKDFVDEETVAELEALPNGDETKEVLIKVTDLDKNRRKLIHEAIRKSFHGLDSSTCDKDGEKFITVKKTNKKQKGRRFQPSSGGNYLHFVLYKENRDTMDAINTIASFLRIPSKVLSYAGTKDKRAKTSQWVSVYRLSAEKLLTINKKFNMIKVGNIVNKSEQIKLGDLRGNKFVIVLRHFQGEKELIERAISSLASRGFINYYGMQRFGTSCVSTHSIGRALLQSNWKSAIDLILKPRLEGDENMANSRKIWMESNDAKRAYENLRNKSSIEGKLFDGLATNNENDLVNALNAIPRNTRLMYIHSYQSYIWNKVLSKRLQKFGLNVLLGDLISKNPSENASDIDVVISKKNSSFNVDFVTEDNIEKVSIKDVLLPLPGHSVTYPKNENEVFLISDFVCGFGPIGRKPYTEVYIWQRELNDAVEYVNHARFTALGIVKLLINRIAKDFYEFFLKEDGMSWGNFESKVRTYSLSGAYRNIIITPSDIHWEIIPYDDVSKPLALSDLDALQGTTVEKLSAGTLKALKLEFKLPSSSYATMAIREISKCSTSYFAR